MTASKTKSRTDEGFTSVGDIMPFSTPKDTTAFKKPRQKKTSSDEGTTIHDRSTQNRRGRVNPAKVPTHLTRTSAFAPYSNNLITDSRFEKVYRVPGYSILRVSGRELGYQHRDALYTIFRIPPKEGVPEKYRENLVGALRDKEIYLTAQASWRELLDLSGVTPHVNNIRTLKDLLQDFQKVIIEEVLGDPDTILEHQKQGRIGGPGSSLPIITWIKWDGDGLNDEVTVIYGASVQKAFQARRLVSLDYEIQRKLSSGYAKSIWPWIDGQPNYTYLTENTIAALIGIEIWKDQKAPTGKTLKASAIRRDFRAKCRKAFDDIQTAGGLSAWSVEKTGKGPFKVHVYHYTHGRPRQMELSFDPENN